ncbi:MAG: radical SAM protein [Desulfotalea sp.]
MYKHLFGPIASRRLGTSLGVDLVVHKICSLDCLYCESGATTNLTCERKEYVSLQSVKQELSHYFQNNPDPDYITFSGAGEPTLNSCIGEVISFISANKPTVKIAVLTNGTLLNNPQVRVDLLGAHLVIPSLDAAFGQDFRVINRPHKSIEMEQYIDGIAQFKEEFTGEMPLEILILPGINDSKENLQELKKAIQKIKPDSIQLNTLDRPGVVDYIKAASIEKLTEISLFLNHPKTTIPSTRKVSKGKANMGNLKITVLDMLKRRPCTVDDIISTIACNKKELNTLLANLIEEKEILRKESDRGSFYIFNHGADNG